MSSLRTGNTGNSDSKKIMQKSKARILKTYLKLHTDLELLIIYYYYIAKIYEILINCSLNNVFSHIMGSSEAAVQCWHDDHQKINRPSHSVVVRLSAFMLMVLTS